MTGNQPSMTPRARQYHPTNHPDQRRFDPATAAFAVELHLRRLQIETEKKSTLRRKLMCRHMAIVSAVSAADPATAAVRWLAAQRFDNEARIVGESLFGESDIGELHKIVGLHLH